VSEWQPIETAPKDGTEILGYAPGVFLNGSGRLVIWWVADRYAKEEFWACYNDRWDSNESAHVTHWQSLPEPPKD
jgi:hypothetical protein